MIPTVTTTSTGQARLTLGIDPAEVYRLHREYLTAMDTYHAPPGPNISEGVRAAALDLAGSYQESLAGLLCPMFDAEQVAEIAHRCQQAADELRVRFHQGGAVA